ncbi:mycothione reductase [Nigerium massiliense]|uniref:mycothione reductase n=1 Tax=Nigerium massiliense TaxID=1522317 RepID=UPI00058DFBB9|nr:mycothione reductase [Nigerium massiliense]
MAHYDLCIIGSGSGNALIDEKLDGLSIALVDDGITFGGTCINRGCIPTKMFAYPADLARTPEAAARVNLQLSRGQADWEGLRDRIFGRIDAISSGGEAWRGQNANVTLYRQTGRFVGDKALKVGDETITADTFVLAAGSRPFLPDVPGVADPALADRLHTSDTIMRLDEQPVTMVILGGGFIAAEFSHIFSSLGTKVTLINRSERLLRREDDDISERFTRLMPDDVNLRLGEQVQGLREGGDGRVAVLTRDADGQEQRYEGDVVLLAQGRVPNGDRLGVQAAGIEVDDRGYVVVDEYQRTSVPGIWALGDVSDHHQLKHVANYQERIVQHNLLHPDDLRAVDPKRVVAHGVFAHPQIAAAGLTEREAREQGIDVAVAKQEYGSVAYGWAMEDTDHFVKLIADKATRQVVGAHILGPEATLLIQPLLLGMTLGIDAPTMARAPYWIHPSLTEVVENALLGLGFPDQG